jgi:DNA-3-methyladenine glycosylase II
MDARHDADRLTRQGLAKGLRVLSRRDSALASVLERHGPPPMWARRPGFPTLVHIILEQQVSLASARAAYVRLRAACGQVTPRRFVGLDDVQLRAIGFSRQKTVYARLLAQAILDGRFRPATLDALSDEAVRLTLMALKGIGKWTADIYLLMALRRPDVWPNGDLALAVAAQRVKRLPARPSPMELEAIGEAWRPWRSVAARILWHAYLQGVKHR